ncbi:IS21 family transposase [Microbacterium kribbense]|uniref:IS21 family transposase n=1 Tax=Microbacterium kribbense TaxID=433645 RepID=UPI0031D27661
MQEEIRRLDAEGVAGRQIARRLGVSRDSVVKYTGQTDYSPTPPIVRRRPGGSVVAGFTDVIDGWLEEDRARPRKQRHTAKRVFDRLVAERGYPGSYSPVQRHVKAWRAAHRTGGDGFLELAWDPGAAQVDFGQADVILDGARARLHMLVVTFPFSNARYAQGYQGETAECVCHGLRTVFEHVGFVPRELVFDNATGIGRRRGQEVTESALFAAFKLHYRCRARYCNPYSGNEKGSVENAVGFLRRNLMVPEPEAAGLAGLNRMLLARCDRLGEADHWRKHQPVRVLFARDKAAGLALPGARFDPVRYEARTADKTGTVRIDGVAYTAGPAYSLRRVTVGLRHDRVQILDENARPAVTLPRVFGAHADTVLDPSVLLPALARKPGAWSESPVRRHVTDPVRDWLDRASPRDRRDGLAVLDLATRSAGFACAIQAADTILARGHTPHADTVGMLARRLAAGVEPDPGAADLTIYDRLGRQATTEQVPA